MIYPWMADLVDGEFPEEWIAPGTRWYRPSRNYLAEPPEGSKRWGELQEMRRRMDERLESVRAVFERTQREAAEERRRRYREAYEHIGHRYRTPNASPEDRIPMYRVDERGHTVVNPDLVYAPYEEVFLRGSQVLEPPTVRGVLTQDMLDNYYNALVRSNGQRS